jgi:hypothetical protein
VLPAGTQLKAVRLHGLIVTPAGRLLVTSGTANDITQVRVVMIVSLAHRAVSDQQQQMCVASLPPG